MTDALNLKEEPAEHDRLSDNDITPLREEPVTSPRIFVSNATGWESDDEEETPVIPKQEPLPITECDENYFAEFRVPREIPAKELKDEQLPPPASADEAASIDWANFDKDFDSMPNGFTKRKQLDDMDLGQQGELDIDMDDLLAAHARLLEMTREAEQEEPAQEEPSTSTHHKKRKKPKKNKNRTRNRSGSEERNKRPRRHSPSPTRNREYRRKSPSLPKEGEYRREERSRERAVCWNNNEGERNHQRRHNSSSQSPQRQDYNESKRDQNYSRVPNGLPHRLVIKPEPEQEPDLEPLSVRDDEKGFIRLVDPSKLMQEKPKPATPILSANEKRQANVERARLAFTQLEMASSKAPQDEFLMVNTITKMPISASYLTKGIFENPSPLRNNFNVAYKFNSISGTEINLAKWGLEALPKETTILLNVLGIDADSLKRIEANTVMPQRILKLRKQAAENGELDIKDEDLMCSGTGLYRTTGTQTIPQSSDHTQDMGTQTKHVEDATENGRTFWQDPKFDIISLTQSQTNVMFALKELSEGMPHQLWAEQLYKPLRNALFIKRNAVKDPRLARNQTR